MTLNYAYTLTIWPSVLTVLLLIVLSIYSERRRNVPGALPFAVSCLFAALWAYGSVMELAAADFGTKIYWVKFQGIWRLPTATAATCFILEYAWPGRWLTRRNLVLLSIPCLLVIGLIFTNDLHQLLWSGFTSAGKVVPLRTAINWMLVAYGYSLSIVNVIVLAWLFVHSTQHRWSVVIMLIGIFLGRGVYLLSATSTLLPDLFTNVPPVAFEYLMYAIALFGFRIFDPVPLARQAVIAQMREGVIVLDPNGRVVSLNPAAQTILGAPAKQLLGMPLQDLLANGTDQAEMMLGTGPNPRYYQLQFSSLDDWRGLEVGRLLLLHDVTEQKRAQSQLLEQQRALAMLYEREQLARELHDGIGQVLGFVKLQAQAARTWLALDQKTAADSDLEKLIAVAQDAHADVREYILGAKLAVSDQDSFILSLRHYLQRFSEHYGLRTELIAPPEWSDNFLEPTAEVQLLRIIQEALSNARKHAQAQTVQVIIHLDEIQAQVTIQDDGVGFEPAGLANDGGQKYGLEFLRQRAVEVGGSAEIHSAPGQGTRVVVCVPLKDTVELDRLGGVEKGRGEHV